MLLFNNLTDLIYIEKIFSDKLMLNNITPQDTQFLDNVIKSEIKNYKIKILNIFKENCVIPNSFFLNQYTIRSGTYKDIFEVSLDTNNNYYKYFVCVIFLDNNSIIKINNKIYEAKIGEIYIFPSAWFFIYEISKKNNSENRYITNNIIGFRKKTIVKTDI